MEFTHKAHLDCYHNALGLLKELFGEQLHVREDRPMMGLTVGSAFVEIAVWPFGDTDAVVNSRAYVVRQVEVTPDLMHWLLRKNDEMRFGAFGLDKDNDIFFEHAIVGSSCDKNELRASVMAVGRTADRLDDEIVGRWGGQRAFD
jgi:hypothetical protein